MDVRIIDSIGDCLFTVQFKDDHLAEIGRRGMIKYILWKNTDGLVMQTPAMKHTDLINVINEMAL